MHPHGCRVSQTHPHGPTRLQGLTDVVYPETAFGPNPQFDFMYKYRQKQQGSGGDIENPERADRPNGQPTT